MRSSLNYTGIILAGGQSSRMGQNKALLTIADHTIIERVAKALQPVVSSLWVAGNHTADYSFLNIRSVPDHFPGQGPLAGLHAALSQIRSEWYVVSACDIPFASTALMQHLIEHTDIKGIQAIIPMQAGRIHPLYAVYHHSVLPSLQLALEHNQLRVRDWLDQQQVHYVEIESLYQTQSKLQSSFQSISEYSLYNMNDPQSYEQVLRILKQYPSLL
ncbi:molybdenum cofactor guanylyltransferase [Paenibacillus sp. KACC 21273]|uniref:molybdenum cofactor guanylyltransferase n=1 Tax=Paenibacillus sp. KACC 21273 TaxID=3025665 RepID=UPI002365D12D|nr:molybdenum cofactor guanylyltransferase [Paenibacillus sp. KACC 21273]WDF51404.1 molybdenum cofactor guanylyltransferase [Paenibacillus sp. KACC 21273]